MDFQLAKELHFRELDRRDELSRAPTLRIGVLTVLGGVYSYLFDSFEFSGSMASWIFIGCAATSAIFALLSIIWIIRSYMGYWWEYLPYPSQLLDYFSELRRYDAEHGLDDSTPERQFDETIRTSFVQAATKNMVNNNARASLLYSASLFLAIAVIAALLAGLLGLMKNLNVL